MHRSLPIFLGAFVLFLPLGGALAAEPRPAATLPATQPAKLPHIQIDLKNRAVRLECQAVNAPSPLEYFVCAAGGAEHETVLRSRAKASHIHMAMLLLGLQPGTPYHLSQPGDQRVAPTGPLLKISCQFLKDGRETSMPAHRMMRSLRTKQPAPPLSFVFVGSRVMADGRYAADVTGHLISVVNFEYSVIDVPELRSSSNNLLEWEINPDTVPPRDATVWLVIEPAEPTADSPQNK